MTAEDFDKILEIIEPDIPKQDTNMRRAVPAKVKLAATLRFLSTGSSYTDLQYQFRIHDSTLSNFVPIACDKIYEKLKDNYMKVR